MKRALLLLLASITIVTASTTLHATNMKLFCSPLIKTLQSYLSSKRTEEIPRDMLLTTGVCAALALEHTRIPVPFELSRIKTLLALLVLSNTLRKLIFNSMSAKEEYDETKRQEGHSIYEIRSKNLSFTTRVNLETKVENISSGSHIEQCRSGQDVIWQTQEGNVKIFAIFDGHGSYLEVAQNIQKELANRFTSFFKEKTKKSGQKATIGSLCKELRNMFLEAGKAISKQAYAQIAGSTANIVILVDHFVFIVNLGDSPALVLTSDNQAWKTEDHHPGLLACPREYARIVDEMKGTVSYEDGTPRVNGRLAVSRSFGDHQHEGSTGKKLMICEPDITVIERNEVQAIIQSSDGLWPNGITTSGITEKVEKWTKNRLSLNSIAKRLVSWARKTDENDDDIAVTIIKFV